MEPITRRFLRVLNGEEYREVQLLEIRPAGATEASTIRLCSPGAPVTWNDYDYTPINMSRGVVEKVLSTDSGDVPSITMTIGNVDNQMAALLNYFEIEGAEATLRVADRTLLANPRDAHEVIVGEVTDVGLTQASLVFQIVGILGQLERSMIPKRLWQQRCNYTFGGRSCRGPVPSFDPLAPPNLVTTAALSGSTEKYIRIPAQALTDAGDPEDPTKFWANGYILFRTGRLATQARPFHRYDVVNGVRRVYPRRPFLVAPEPDDVFVIKRQCGHDPASCEAIQGHVLNYGGYSDVPYGATKPNIVSGA